MPARDEEESGGRAAGEEAVHREGEHLFTARGVKRRCSQLEAVHQEAEHL